MTDAEVKMLQRCGALRYYVENLDVREFSDPRDAVEILRGRVVELIDLVVELAEFYSKRDARLLRAIDGVPDQVGIHGVGPGRSLP